MVTTTVARARVVVEVVSEPARSMARTRSRSHADLYRRNKVMPDWHLDRAIAQKIFNLLGTNDCVKPFGELGRDESS